MRIASLVPSGTDLAIALGLERALVGVSCSCDHELARGKPILTRARIPLAPGDDPAKVDRAIADAIADDRVLYETDSALLAELAPTIVIAQDVCDVCAIDARAAQKIVPAGATLVRLTASSVRGAKDDLDAIARAAGVLARATEVWAEIESRLERVRSRAEGARRVRTATLEWGDPPFSAGHWVPELIEIAGGEELLARAGERSRRIEGRAIAAADPELMLYAPCGYSLEEAAREAARILARSEAQLVPAVKRGDFFALDATRLLSRCTTNVARAAEVIAGILHPDRFDPPREDEARRITPASWT